MDEKQIVVRRMARALARGGLVNAFGHCSVRLDGKRFLVCSPRPMGLIGPGEPGQVVPIEGTLPDGVLGEVRMHQQIYKRRADVHAVARVLPPNVLALAAMGLTPKARHGFGAYFYPEVPFWPDPGLIRNDAAAAGVAETMGSAAAVVVSVNGAVIAAATPEQAVTLAWFLEDAARVELAVLATGVAGTLLTAEQARDRATWVGRVAERMWDHLTAGDPE
jgi:HCOMODA/2-hydroxy-3-carboxy-muconic semialdehyde decarboxylase